MADDMRWIKTHCRRMDHGGCAILAGVKDNQIVKIKGDQGVCKRGLGFYKEFFKVKYRWF